MLYVMIRVIYDPCKNGFTILKLSSMFSAAVATNINSNMNEDKNLGRLIILLTWLMVRPVLVIITFEINLKLFRDSFLPFISIAEKI